MRRSRTDTLPLVTRVSVPSQRSETNHVVPRTVMTLLLARVRNCPWRSWPQSERGGRRRVTEAARAPPEEQVGSAPRRTSSVMPWPPIGWRTSKSPPWKVPVWVAPAGSAACSFTVPARVSTIEPTGTDAPSASAAARVAPGTRTRTVPPAGATPTLRPSCGGAAGAGTSSVPGSGEGATVAGRGAVASWAATAVVKVTSAPGVTPLSLEATTRTW